MADADLTCQSLVYVCLMSDYSLPNLEAIMVRQPSDVVLIVTNYPPARDAADRLAEVLKNRLPMLTLHRPDQQLGAEAFSGDNPIEAQHWVDHVLAPFLEHFQSQPCWLNMTGGTKALSLAMLVRLSWDGIDYKPAGKNELLHFNLRPDGNALAQLNDVGSHAARTPLSDIDATDVARLYNHSVNTSESKAKMFAEPERYTLAEAIFSGLSEQDTGLEALFALFNHVWSEQRDDIALKVPKVALSIPEALSKTGHPQAITDIQAWLERFNALADAFHLDHQTLTLPGNAKLPTNIQALKRWLESEWLEQLVYHWVRQARVPERGIALNVYGGEDPRNSSTHREADLLIQHLSRTYVIEIKAAIPPDSNIRAIQTQLASLQDHFGRAQLILFVGPVFRHQLSEEKWQAFVDRATAGNSRVCSTRDELLAALNLQPSQGNAA
ncbi:hypothetical protein Q9247_15950 [Halomonas meridiana]|uniref:hypothetical protein n=1 Tax=Vreelandella aquamarina TaxID=77097 RepID=UPI00273B16C4|nr:hypothetical protein [Halomonas meridiana]MDP4559166.1 hypothetical protein [Halomonas meridiana]